MLLEMSIRNLAVIESVHLHFRKGFHVLTGETGAGKSIIIDALTLVAGGRSSADLVRYGSDKSTIEALFHIEAGHPVWAALAGLGIEADAEEHLIIRREITSQGKSTSRINGQMINQTGLKTVGAWLVNIHGQHEHQSLFQVEQHINWLDLFGEAAIMSIKNEYTKAYQVYTGIRKRLKDLETTSKQSLQMLDLYRFQVEEINTAQLILGEDESLNEEKRKLANAEKIYQNAADSYESMSSAGSGLETINKMMQQIEDIAPLDPAKLNPLMEQIQNAYYQLEDAVYQIRDYRDDIEFNPIRLDDIEQRLHMIASLRRKYGDSIADILAYVSKVQKELDLIENKDELLQELQKQEKQAAENVRKWAKRLSEQRQLISEKLASEIVAELRDLHMDKTQFKVQIRYNEAAFGVNGADDVEFLISANPGEPLRSLSKIASGGEISRVMLALKSIFARVDRIPVLVFDEVDTGVSGRAAQAIAEKMSRLSRDCQVFSITHLPQVACMADSHYCIHKSTDGTRTFTNVDDLDMSGRIHELARMLGGVEVTETTLQHAQEMLDLAEDKKRSM
ncbi:DNA repair protein RecN [Paenibacillus agricola]|uniref:DNA repair protein RecN n=1 Tax=Paenibacillus agricola TaxID=2716264 RepID=A0ABX0IXZ1_9BACL|nr:DNA repair protein RecN [Paenibacillus agricola]NHN28822.1 DNA repair protein RecN [Paenibacillus agricola]